MHDLAKLIDHTLLYAYVSEKNLINLCRESIEFGFYSVCVNPVHIHFCKQKLHETEVKVTSVIGFPLGQNTTLVKAIEAERAISEGVDEIDMVINISFIKDKKYLELKNELRVIREIMGEEKVLKLILETCFLSDDEIRVATRMGMETGVDFIKTSTGFGSRGVNERDLKIIKMESSGEIKIKASGGIKNLKTMRHYLELGANRIGTSNGVNIMREYLAKKK